MAIAIGDIHGCLEPLQALVRRLPEGKELVFLGDYVDRGPHSAQVLRYVEELAQRRPCQLLLGNHEQLMADAIADAAHVPLWFMNGGDTTVASYGEDPPQWARRPPGQRMLPGFERFYGLLRLFHEDDTAIYVHAGIDLAVARMEDQRPEVLLWIRERFFANAERWQGKSIIFGHTPTLGMGLPSPMIFQSHRLYGIDTGCVYGGVLTALDSETFQTWQEPGYDRLARYR